MKGLKNSIYALGVSALSLLPVKSEAGTLAGRVTDMFSNAPYNNINVTLVDDSGNFYETTTGLPATAVEPSSWGLIKNNFMRSPKLNALEQALDGTYAVDVPDGVCTLAFTDGKVSATKPSSGDLFGIQVDLSKRTIPRAFRLKVNGETRCDETLLPPEFDLEYAWTVLSGKVVRYDYNNITFYIDIGPARKDWIPTTNGKLPTQTEIDNVVGAINEFVRLDTNGKVTPRIEVGTNPPKDDVVNPKNGTLMVEPEYALFFWDSKLPIGALGTGAPFVDDSGRVTSSFARVMPGVGYNVVINEVLGAAGLHGEPGTDKELNARIRNTGGSIFLDGNTGPITERDAQIIKYHGTRPIGTTPNDNSNRIVNE